MIHLMMRINAMEQTDQFGYLQGRRFASECLRDCWAASPSTLNGILMMLERNALQKPPSEAKGIIDIVMMVRVLGGGR